MPTIAPVDALIKKVDKLVDAISGVMPKHSITKDAVLLIYQKQALEASMLTQLKGAQMP